jgi:hypothetical protein
VLAEIAAGVTVGGKTIPMEEARRGWGLVSQPFADVLSIGGVACGA